MPQIRVPHHPVPDTSANSPLKRDLSASVAVFLVALPLCMGIALASGAPVLSGLISGIVGGVVVGAISGSQTSVSGPAAGLTTIVLAQIATLGSFEAFLLAVGLAGVIQIGLGLARAGMLAAFFPSNVIKGLLAAIGIVLILKQIPHVFGHDTDPEGEMAFSQPDHENTLSELLQIFGDLHVGAATVGILSLLLLVAWERFPVFRKLRLPPMVAAVLLGLGLGAIFDQLGAPWAISSSHLVAVPVAESFSALSDLLQLPDLSQWSNPAIYTAALTIAVVASLETLLNLEAVDNLDPERRVSPPNRELVAQGVGNVVCGLVGGLPLTSVVVRGSVNVHAGGATKRSTIVHGVLLLVSITTVPTLLNRIPLACLAAILLVTGFKLASPKTIRKVWASGRDQFAPFAATILAIVFTDLLVGLAIGMAVSFALILRRQTVRPMRRLSETHVDGNLMHIELPDQVSFLNQLRLETVLNEAKRGTHLLLDARRTDYIDPDVLALIREYRDETSVARGVHLSMVGFHEAYNIRDEIQFVDYSTRELQDRVTPADVLEFLRKGNERFATGKQLYRDLSRQVDATADGQHPLAVVLSCIDSRTPAELILDMGLGDIFSVRVAGNGLNQRIIGSMEYGCAVAGSRLILVVGHTRCGAVTAAVDLAGAPSSSVEEATGCEHLQPILHDIQRSMEPGDGQRYDELPPAEREAIVNRVARRNVVHVVQTIPGESKTLARLIAEGRIAVVGALYNVTDGTMEFLIDDAIGLD